MQGSGTPRATGGTRESEPMRSRAWSVSHAGRHVTRMTDRKWTKQSVGVATCAAKSWSKSSGPSTSAFMEATFARMLALALLSSLSVSSLARGGSRGSILGRCFVRLFTAAESCSACNSNWARRSILEHWCFWRDESRVRRVARRPSRQAIIAKRTEVPCLFPGPSLHDELQDN